MANPVRAIALEGIQNIEQVYVRHGPFCFTVNGMAPPTDGTPPIEEWGAAGNQVGIVARSPAFVVGDWVRYGEERYSELAAQYIDARQWSKSTLDVYRRLSGYVPPSVRRMDRLGTRHHLLIQKLSVAEQRRWLTRAAADDEAEPWTVERLREAIREGQDATAVAWYVTVALPDGKKHAAFVKRMEREGYAPKSRIRYQFTPKAAEK